MNNFVILFVLLSSEALAQDTEERLEPEYKEGFLQASDNLTYVQALGGITDGFYKIIKWKYHFKLFNFSPTSPPPIIYFRHVGQEAGYNTKNRCIGGKDFENFYGYDPRLVVIRPFRKTPGLEKQCTHEPNNTSVLTCEGSLSLAVGKTVQWFASVGFQCSSKLKRPLELSYNISIIPFNRVQCHPTKNALSSVQEEIPTLLQYFISACSDLYENYSEFNVLGFQPLIFLRGFQIFYREEDTFCYKHLLYFACRTTLPECIDGRIIQVCADVCNDYRIGCSNSTLATTLECNSYVRKDSSNKCEYRPVLCSFRVPVPDNAVLVSRNGTNSGSIARFECMKDYELQGRPVSVCTNGGNWAPDASFECVKARPATNTSRSNQSSAIISVTISVFVVTLAVIMTILVCMIFRFEVKILKHKYSHVKMTSKGKTVDRTKLYHAFIAYHHEWYTLVRDQIHNKLESRGYKIFTDYNDIILGENLVERIPEAISQSYRVIIILNQQFLDSNWCKYELHHSFIQLIEDNYFDVLVVLTENPNKLKHVPRSLKAHLRTKVYIESSNKNLVDQIIKNLPPPSACASSQRGTQNTTGIEDSIAGEIPDQDSDSGESIGAKFHVEEDLTENSILRRAHSSSEIETIVEAAEHSKTDTECEWETFSLQIQETDSDTKAKTIPSNASIPVTENTLF